MTSCQELEGWLSTLGAGIAGLRLLKEYGIRTSELEYFIENLGDLKIKVSAFAPSPLKTQYEPLLSQTEAKLKSGIEKIKDPKVSGEALDSVLKDAKELYSLLSDMHQAAVSGLIIV